MELKKNLGKPHRMSALGARAGMYGRSFLIENPPERSESFRSCFRGLMILPLALPCNLALLML